MLCDKYKQNKGYLNDVEKNKTKSTIRKFFRSLFISSDQLNNYLQINCDDEEMKKKKKNSRKKNLINQLLGSIYSVVPYLDTFDVFINYIF